MGTSVTGKRRYTNGDICKYFIEGEQPEGWVLGTPKSIKNKLSNSVKALWANNSYRLNQFEKRHTEEYHNKIVEINKKSWEINKKERSLKLSESAKKRFENLDERNACKERMKSKWLDNEYREKQSKALKNSHANLYKEHPEYLETISKSNHTTWISNKEIILRKQFNTKSLNNSWNSSKLEEDYYKLLLTKYDENDIIRQYFDKNRYPFYCDFYIKSEDKFIELQGTWTHGGKPFDPNDENDIKKLDEWLNKSKESSYYKNAIKVWTETDVLKRKVALQNNLNIEFIY